MSNTTIAGIHAREVIDSRGNPTVEVDVILAGGARRARGVPSGASTGEHEAWELRDGDKKRYVGKGVTKAVGEREQDHRQGARRHGRARSGRRRQDDDRARRHEEQSPSSARTPSSPSRWPPPRPPPNQLGQPLFKYLGGPNAKVLPVPMMNIINGGAHSDAPIDFQEFMIVPKRFAEFLRRRCAPAREIFHALKSVLKDRGLSTAVGDEGGFAPNFEQRRRRARNHRARRSRKPATSSARTSSSRSTSPPRNSTTRRRSNTSSRRPTARSAPPTNWSHYYAELQKKYPIISIEDGCAENDWAGWKKLTDKLGATIQLVGDDLFVTNVEFLTQGHRDRHGQLDPREGEPDRLAHRDARRHRTGQGKQLHRRHLAIAPARPRTPPSPTSPWRPTPARSRPAR